MKSRIYLDYNATAPIRAQVVEVMAEVMALPANPSSVHWYGREAKKRLEQARKTIAESVSCFPAEILFTASGTESNNLAIKSFSDRKMLVGATEHSSVLQTAQGAEILPVDENGIINFSALERKLQESPLAFVSVMLANNETGVIQPIRDIAALVHRHGGLLHCDAIQALGKLPVDVGMLGADLMSLSAHKLGGPQGVAVLVARQNIPIKKQMHGGGQELGRRGGTENLAAIAGFGRALELAQETGWQKQLRTALNAMEDAMLAAIPGTAVLGKGLDRLPNTTCVLMPGVSAETQLMHFDLEGIAVSAGSACSSGRIEPSHVIRAMGLEEKEAATAIRISGGWATTDAEIHAFTQAWLDFAAKRQVA